MKKGNIDKHNIIYNNFQKRQIINDTIANITIIVYLKKNKVVSTKDHCDVHEREKEGDEK